MASSSTESFSSHESSSFAYYDVIEEHEPETPLDRARKIISRIERARFYEYIPVLSHSSLGDDGLIELFSFLRRDTGRQYRITYIALDWTGIGDRCLEVFVEWLAVDKDLRRLKLHNDEIRWQGDEPVMLKLFSAINSSQVMVLVLNTRNQQLCDPFLISFTSQLDAPVLRRLEFDGFGLTSASTPALISYLTSPRSRMLEHIGCGQSRFSRPGLASTFLTALLESNSTLSNLQMRIGYYSTDTHSDDPDVYESTVADEKELLSRLHLRNKALSQKTQEEARLLLLCSRILLHYPAPRPRPGGPTQPVSKTASSSPVSASVSVSTPAPSFPFHALPVELRQHVLVFLTPALSHAQHLRVFASAASFPLLGTEPWLMTSAKCLYGYSKCSDMGDTSDESTEFRRSHAWVQWLKDVGCIRFEPSEGLTEADVPQLLMF